MGRNTEIFMLNKKKASTNLFKDLKHLRIYKRTFEEFINDRKQEVGHTYTTSYDKILSIVKEDINNISPDDLFEITYYLDEELTHGKYDNSRLDWNLHRELREENVKKADAVIENYGLNLLYKIHTSTSCYSYMFQFGNFTDFFPIKENYDEGCNISSNDFLTFNDYMILIMSRIVKSELYKGDIEVDETEGNTIKNLIQKYKNDQIMSMSIDKEFDWLKFCMNEDGETYKAEKNTVDWAHLFLLQSLEMKRKINPKINSRIVIIDSI